MVWSIVYAFMGVFAIFYGVKIFLTGKVSASEERKIADYSNKGARTYKLINAVLSILAGLCITGQGVLRVLENQKIVEDTFPFRVVIWGILIVMVIVYFIIAAKCKNMTDDE